MMIIARPSISTYLTRTLYELGIPAVLTEEMTVPMRPALKTMTPAQFAADPRTAYRSLILTSSENALSRLYDVIPYDDRIMKSRLFKDKAAFRRAIARKFPRFYFREVEAAKLAQIPASEIPFPVVLKPSIGISSIGVTRVETAAEWPGAVKFLQDDLRHYQKNYARDVVESRSVIIEKCIEGRELAIDGYYNSAAEPVVLDILEHVFLDARDTSDRIYLTRKSIVEEFLAPVMRFLKEFGEIFDLKRFPFHLEVRVDRETGELVPIELNPLRFSGLGTTEVAQYAYGINVYEYFFRERKPDWNTILNREDDSVYAFMCADIPTEYFRKPGLRVLDRALVKEFTEVLEYRLLDDQETSTFAVVFFRCEGTGECERFLRMDFNRFMELPEAAEQAAESETAGIG